MVYRIELRIHAGAPSSRRHDDKCRSLADAYIAFNGMRCTPRPETVPSTAIHLMPHEAQSPHNAMDDSTSVSGVDETTFVEDTQLAFTALESQIVTSSLTVPNTTLARRPSGEGDISSWPEDLDMHSPEKQRSKYGSSQLQDSSPDEYAESLVLRSSHAKGPRSSDPMRSGKHGSFRLPMKRPVVTLDDLAPTGRGEPLMHERENKSPRSQGSTSSYLKTPVLDRSRKRSRFIGPHDQRVSGETSHFDGPPANERSPPDQLSKARFVSQIAEYREQTPQKRLIAPYVPNHQGTRPDFAGANNGKALVTPERRLDVAHIQDSEEGNESTSELPTTYSLSDITSGSSKKPTLNSSFRSNSDPGPARDSDARDEGQSNQSHSQPPQLEASTNFVIEVPPSRGIAMAAIDEAVDNRQATVSDVDTRVTTLQPSTVTPHVTRGDLGTLASLSDLPISIQPPGPQVSIGPFTTHVTRHLRLLVENPVLENSYKPVSAARELRTLERGYWLVDVSTCPAAVQFSFWTFLEKFIGTGNAGWGVWCTRVMDEDTVTSEGEFGSGLGLTKVFCWGEVVKHVYLLLYVASNSKVRNLGLQWFDAEQKLVVQMRSKG